MLVLVLAAAPARAASPFEWRGVVEGAYGPTWDHAQRERVLRWMPAHGFNAYVHAPKDDLFQRTHWRDPYPPAQQEEFDAETRLARSLGVEWIPNLSPALPLIPTPALPDRPPSRDLCFSCPEDLEAVRRKLEPFRAAGARTVMISFDDVTKTLTHPQDVAAYGTGDEGFGRANGDFLTRLRASYGGAVRVLTVGADYSGTADTAYLRGLRATLDPAVDVMWTGTGIPAQHWRAEDARAYGEHIGRRPLVWENWTNNDTAGNATPAGSVRLFLGPYTRKPDVAGSVGGFFFNPMNEADLNLLPLATAGDWMRDPARYRPQRSWRAAVRELAGRRRSRREGLRAWAEASWSNKLDEREAPTFATRSEAFLARYGGDGAWQAPHRALLTELRLARDAARAMPSPAWAEQAWPWLQAARVAAGAGMAGADLLAAERPELRLRRVRYRRGRTRAFVGRARPPQPDRAEGARAEYEEGKQAFDRSTRFVYGWRGGTAFEIPPYAVPRNLMDVWFDRVDALDSEWRSRADEAASGVTLTLRGRPVALADDGSFRLGRRACGRMLTATDGAGGVTSRRLPRCRRAR